MRSCCEHESLGKPRLFTLAAAVTFYLRMRHHYLPLLYHTLETDPNLHIQPTSSTCNDQFQPLPVGDVPQFATQPRNTLTPALHALAQLLSFPQLDNPPPCSLAFQPSEQSSFPLEYQFCAKELGGIQGALLLMTCFGKERGRDKMNRCKYSYVQDQYSFGEGCASLVYGICTLLYHDEEFQQDSRPDLYA